MRQPTQGIHIGIKVIVCGIDQYAHDPSLTHEFPLRHLAPFTGFAQGQFAVFVQKQRQHALHSARGADAVQACAGQSRDGATEGVVWVCGIGANCG